jgi:hypothetical protein
LGAGWDELVEALDAGGYVRYDFKTATKLLEVMRALGKRYGGDLNRLHRMARNGRDLEDRLRALGKGIGDVTVQIFLRELRNLWSKADPPLSPLATLAAEHLRLLGRAYGGGPMCEIQRLQRCWRANAVAGYAFLDFEAALVRLGRDYCRKQRFDRCPMKPYCRPTLKS